MRNLYKVLGIASTADGDRIKSAFRRRAKRTHPDLNPGGRRTEERFHELMEAYQVLRDARSRATYDAHLAQRRREARRRFVHSAAVMVATFMLTTSSAVFLVGLQGISVHSQTWQIATAWLTSVEVEPAEDAKVGTPFATKVVASPSSGKQGHAVTDVRPSTAPSKGPSSARGKTEHEAGAKGPRKVASAAPKTGSAAHDPSRQESWWSWPRY